MKEVLKASRLAAAVQILAMCAMGCVGIFLIGESLRRELAAIYLCFGAIALFFATACVLAIVEGQSALLDPDGVQQTRIFYAGRFIVRGRIAWNDIRLFRQRNLTYRFKGDEFEARMNIASFNNEKEFVEFVQAFLPTEILTASLARDLVPSQPNAVGRWAIVISTFLCGLWLVTDVRMHLSDIPVHVWGYALLITSIAGAKRVLEASSVRLDDQGVEQLKVFNQRQFLVKRRLAWEDVLKASTFLATCKLEGPSFYIRVDASYFVENDEVACFVNRHLPANVFGKMRPAQR